MEQQTPSEVVVSMLSLSERNQRPRDSGFSIVTMSWSESGKYHVEGSADLVTLSERSATSADLINVEGMAASSAVCRTCAAPLISKTGWRRPIGFGLSETGKSGATTRIPLSIRSVWSSLKHQP